MRDQVDVMNCLQKNVVQSRIVLVFILAIWMILHEKQKIISKMQQSGSDTFRQLMVMPSSTSYIYYHIFCGLSIDNSK